MFVDHFEQMVRSESERGTAAEDTGKRSGSTSSATLSHGEAAGFAAASLVGELMLTCVGCDAWVGVEVCRGASGGISGAMSASRLPGRRGRELLELQIAVRCGFAERFWEEDVRLCEPHEPRGCNFSANVPLLLFVVIAVESGQRQLKGKIVCQRSRIRRVWPLKGASHDVGDRAMHLGKLEHVNLKTAQLIEPSEMARASSRGNPPLEQAGGGALGALLTS